MIYLNIEMIIKRIMEFLFIYLKNQTVYSS